MVSLDVVSLFSKVPVDDVLNFIERKIQQGEIVVPIPGAVFISLLKVCIDGNVFEFEGMYFRQRFGIAMGSPLSPVMAGLFMEYFESELLPTIATLPPLWIRYVDDILLMWRDEDNFEDFFSAVNSLTPSIRFTVEWEEEGKIPFLDTMTHRLPTGFSFAVYRKTTHSGQYLHYYSGHPEKVKQSVLFSMLLRAYRICDGSSLQVEINYIRKTFKGLGYPPSVIEKVHSKVRTKFFSPMVHTEPPSPKPTVRLPHNQFTEKYMAPTLRAQNLRVANPSYSSIGSKIVRRRPSSALNCGVYIIPCSDCELSYVGQTGKDLGIRLQQHRDAVRLGKWENAVYRHRFETSHAINWNGARLVYKSPDEFKRLTVESSLIMHVPNFNLTLGSTSIDKFSGKLILNSKPSILK